MDHPRVLLAEDDADLRRSLARLLAADGMKVVEVGSGAAALSTLATGGFDLVVTDVMMPPPVGIEVATLARTAGKDVPILVITALRDRWVDEAVGYLQRAQLLHKPFSGEQLLERVHALVERPSARSDGGSVPPPEIARVFPPSLVPMLRERLDGESPSAASVDDEVLAELLTVAFFAGLETEEGERNPIRLVLTGAASIDAEPTAECAAAPLCRWSPLRFRTGRPFSVVEIVKLAAATRSERVFTEVRCVDGRLTVTGLAREGVNLEGDPYLKVIVTKPGGLSVRSGRRHLLEYEQGRVQSVEGDGVFSRGPVRRALERSALEAGVEPGALHAYLDTVRALVAELSAHGSGGILVFSADEVPVLPSGSPYLTYPDVSLVAILRRIRTCQRRGSAPEIEGPDGIDDVLQSTFVAELERTIEEFGALSSLDGATVLDRSLTLAGFGVVLPIRSARNEALVVVEARDMEATDVRPFDLGTRGTRHRAAATYAMSHPGAVVFVASRDGPLGCFYRGPASRHVALWRFRTADLRGRRP
jgi:CheY-like chemotaxis protein